MGSTQNHALSCTGLALAPAMHPLGMAPSHGRVFSSGREPLLPLLTSGSHARRTRSACTPSGFVRLSPARDRPVPSAAVVSAVHYPRFRLELAAGQPKSDHQCANHSACSRLGIGRVLVPAYNIKGLRRGGAQRDGPFKALPQVYGDTESAGDGGHPSERVASGAVRACV